MRLSGLLPLFIALPSVVIGSMAMHFNGISTIIWSQNIVGLLIAGFISYYMLQRKPKIERGKSSSFTVLISIILLLLTFLDIGLDGVHRWISIGPIKFYIGSIVMPILIIELWRILQTQNWWIPTIITIGVSVLLVLQPDASQTTAFLIPMLIILFSEANNNIYRYFAISVLPLLIIVPWIFLDNLSPVVYVEDILILVSNMGFLWLVLGIISLVILPLPFILVPQENFKLLSISLGIYFMLILISTILGNFPVPLMGYGISPIIGYFIAITWLIKTKKNRPAIKR